MSGILAVYSLVVAVLISQDLNPPTQQSYTLFKYVAKPIRPNRTCVRCSHLPLLLSARTLAWSSSIS
jgi:hypothetical protein